VDEFVGLPAADPHCQRNVMYDTLYSLPGVDIPSTNVHSLDAWAPSLPDECAAFEKKIEVRGRPESPAG
jgi:hypothetical protein